MHHMTSKMSTEVFFGVSVFTIINLRAELSKQILIQKGFMVLKYNYSYLHH